MSKNCVCVWRFSIALALSPALVYMLVFFSCIEQDRTELDRIRKLLWEYHMIQQINVFWVLCIRNGIKCITAGTIILPCNILKHLIFYIVCMWIVNENMSLYYISIAEIQTAVRAIFDSNTKNWLLHIFHQPKICETSTRLFFGSD